MINELTLASSRAVDMFVSEHRVNTKRLRQQCWRWDRSEGATDMPRRRYFRNPPVREL